MRDITDIIRKAGTEGIEPITIGSYELHFKRRANLELAMMAVETMVKGRLTDEGIKVNKDTDYMKDYLFADSDLGTDLRVLFINSITKGDDKDLVNKIAKDLDVEVSSTSYAICKEVMPKITELMAL